MVDCNLLIPIPFQLFCQLPKHFLSTFPNNDPPFFPLQKNTPQKPMEKTVEKPIGFSGIHQPTCLKVGVLGAWIELGLSCEIRPGHGGPHLPEFRGGWFLELPKSKPEISSHPKDQPLDPPIWKGEWTWIYRSGVFFGIKMTQGWGQDT